METSTEQAAIGLLRVAGITDAFSHDDHAKRETMDGISVSAKAGGMISCNSNNQNRVDRIDLTISIRSLIPKLDPKQVGDLWEKITKAILSPTLPPLATDWTKEVPAFSKFSLFHCMAGSQSGREDNDTARKHTREFIIYVTMKN